MFKKKQDDKIKEEDLIKEEKVVVINDENIADNTEKANEDVVVDKTNHNNADETTDKKNDDGEPVVDEKILKFDPSEYSDIDELKDAATKYIKLKEDNEKKSVKQFTDFYSMLGKLRKDNEEEKKQFFDKASKFENDAQDKVNEFKEKFIEQKNAEFEKEKEFILQKFFGDLIPKLFNIEIAANSGGDKSPELHAYVQGFKMLVGQIFSSLESHGISIIEPNVGDDYDPHIHHSIELVASDSKSGTIASVISKGFQLKERVLEPSKVKVTK